MIATKAEGVSYFSPENAEETVLAAYHNLNKLRGSTGSLGKLEEAVASGDESFIRAQKILETGRCQNALPVFNIDTEEGLEMAATCLALDMPGAASSFELGGGKIITALFSSGKEEAAIALNRAKRRPEGQTVSGNIPSVDQGTLGTIFDFDNSHASAEATSNLLDDFTQDFAMGFRGECHLNTPASLQQNGTVQVILSRRGDPLYKMIGRSLEVERILWGGVKRKIIPVQRISSGNLHHPEGKTVPPENNVRKLVSDLVGAHPDRDGESLPFFIAERDKPGFYLEKACEVEIEECSTTALSIAKKDIEARGASADPQHHGGKKPITCVRLGHLRNQEEIGRRIEERHPDFIFIPNYDLIPLPVCEPRAGDRERELRAAA